VFSSATAGAIRCTARRRQDRRERAALARLALDHELGLMPYQHVIDDRKAQPAVPPVSRERLRSTR
jgi:hypothetical protein